MIDPEAGYSMDGGEHIIYCLNMDSLQVKVGSINNYSRTTGVN